MAKWLTSLSLIVTLGGSALAGMPLHTIEQECSLDGQMSKMDCCAKAHSPESTTEATAARLCCAMNCPQDGTTAPTGLSQRTTPLSVIAPHPATIQPPLVLPKAELRRSWLAQDHLQNSHPAYIRHLALLI